MQLTAGTRRAALYTIITLQKQVMLGCVPDLLLQLSADTYFANELKRSGLTAPLILFLLYITKAHKPSIAE